MLCNCCSVSPVPVPADSWRSEWGATTTIALPYVRFALCLSRTYETELAQGSAPPSALMVRRSVPACRIVQETLSSTLMQRASSWGGPFEASSQLLRFRNLLVSPCRNAKSKQAVHVIRAVKSFIEISTVLLGGFFRSSQTRMPADSALTSTWATKQGAYVFGYRASIHCNCSVLRCHTRVRSSPVERCLWLG